MGLFGGTKKDIPDWRRNRRLRRLHEENLRQIALQMFWWEWRAFPNDEDWDATVEELIRYQQAGPLAEPGPLIRKLPTGLPAPSSKWDVGSVYQSEVERYIKEVDEKKGDWFNPETLKPLLGNIRTVIGDLMVDYDEDDWSRIKRTMQRKIQKRQTALLLYLQTVQIDEEQEKI